MLTRAERTGPAEPRKSGRGSSGKYGASEQDQRISSPHVAASTAFFGAPVTGAIRDGALLSIAEPTRRRR
jgi:hypothetical protein